MRRLIKIYDTTLRDGTQGEGVSFSMEDKVRLATRLDALGIHYIEGGWPGSNPKDLRFFRRMQDVTFKHAKLAAFSMTRRAGSPADSDANMQALLDAGAPVATIVGKSWDFHVMEAIGTTLTENLAMIDETMLAFCATHSILISTSLDGPRDLHNRNRPRPGGDSYEKTIRGINLARDRLGRDQVAALMTTTQSSLARARDIVDEYVAQGFSEIFLRPLSPYGFALKTKSYAAYGVQQWLEFYKEGVEYIIELNKRGISFRECYASIVLKKMFTSDDPGYVDLMSPAGIGIGAIVYNYDGSVYASDESRMLAEMGDSKFRIGDVGINTYEEIFASAKLLDPIEESFAYSVPMCNDCAFEPYCGADPVFHYGRYGDFVGRKAESEFCRRNMGIFRHLIARMEEDASVKRLFLRWANG